MEINEPSPQSTSSQAYVQTAATPSIFGTKIPSTVAFAIAVLLFFMPFIEIKCNGTSLQTVSGLELATGFKMKNNSSGNSFMNDVKTGDADKEASKTNSQSDNKDPNLFAMIAMGLGVLGLALSFANAKAAMGGAMLTGAAAAAALIGLLIDLKKNIKSSIPKSEKNSNDTGGTDIGEGLNNIGKQMNDSLNITVDFTPWFYIALIAFLAAAFFCYKRMAASKT